MKDLNLSIRLSRSPRKVELRAESRMCETVKSTPPTGQLSQKLRINQAVLVVKNPPASAGDVRGAGLIPGSGRSPGGENGNPLQYSCLENPMDRGAWRATVHGITKSWTRLK